jgi:hypothetical protein
MRGMMIQLPIWVRVHHRTQSVKLARTIADLAGERRDPIRAFGGGVAIQAGTDDALTIR